MSDQQGARVLDLASDATMIHAFIDALIGMRSRSRDAVEFWAKSYEGGGGGVLILRAPTQAGKSWCEASFASADLAPLFLRAGNNDR